MVAVRHIEFSKFSIKFTRPESERDSASILQISH